MLNPVIEQRIRDGETCRMFKSDFFEWFSRVPGWAPFATYLPVIAFFFWRIARRGDVAWLTVAGLVALGLLVWTLAEYVLHRYVFHFVREAEWTKKLHFFLHGVHHDFPNDKDRLVMPLGASIPMAVLFYAIFYVVTGGVRFAEPLYIGFAFGYLAYDGSHYAIHHFKQTTRVGKYLKKHHMKHHHGDNFGGFGVSSPLWDLVFGTMPKIVKRSERAAEAASH